MLNACFIPDYCPPPPPPSIPHFTTMAMCVAKCEHVLTSYNIVFQLPTILFLLAKVACDARMPKEIVNQSRLFMLQSIYDHQAPALRESFFGYFRIDLISK